MTKSKAHGRIKDAMLDEILGDADPTELFQSGELLAEMRRKLAERILDAEMDEHLTQSAAQDQGNVRNGHNAKTVLTDSGHVCDRVFGCDPRQGTRGGCGDHAGSVFSPWDRRDWAQGSVRSLAR